MKTLRTMLTMALLVAAGVANANNYDFLQDDVVIGEDAPVAEAVPAPSVESYGVMPSWANGCCERQPSKADHLWDNYCYEKDCCLFHRGHCCQKSYCGSGPFAKTCCKGKCAPKFHMPKLNIWNKCCQKSKCVSAKVKSCTQKCCPKAPCCQKAKSCCQKPCCKETKCCKVSKRCHKPLLAKFKLFRGCHGSKCGKGKGKGGMVVPTTSNYGDAIPSPAMDGVIIEDEAIEMPIPAPPAPAINDPAA